jgi:hypothetical protein
MTDTLLRESMLVTLTRGAVWVLMSLVLVPTKKFAQEFA